MFAPEPLESRRLLSAAAGAEVWRIYGDAGGKRGAGANDVIVVEPVEGQAGVVRATLNGTEVGTRDVASLAGIEVYAGRGDDTVDVSAGGAAIPITVDGGAGDDALTGSGGAETLIGGAGNDTLDGGGGDDVLIGGGGADQILGGDGSDVIHGGAGADVLAGGWGADSIFGEAGKDKLDGGGDADDVQGGPGPDTLAGGDGADTLRGGRGRDHLLRQMNADALPDTTTDDEGDTQDEDTRADDAPTRAHDEAELRQWLIDAAVAQWKWAFGQPAYSWNYGYGSGGEVRVFGITPGAPTTVTDPVSPTPPVFFLNGGVRTPVTSPTATSTPTPTPAPITGDGSSNSAGNGGSDSSGTNVQEQGVDEADLVETDGRYIYSLQNNELVIVDAQPADGMRVVSRTPVEGEGVGIYLVGGRVTVLTGTYPYYVIPIRAADDVAGGDAAGGQSDIVAPPVPAKPKVVVTVLDVTDPSSPSQVEKTTLDGSYGSSRMVGDRLYVTVGNNTWVPAPRTVEKDGSSSTPTPTPTPPPVETPTPTPDSGATSYGSTSAGAPIVIGFPPTPVDTNQVYELEASYRDYLAGLPLTDLLPSYSSTVPTGDGQTSGLLVTAQDTYLRSLAATELGQNLTTLAMLHVGDGAGGVSATSTVAGWGGTVYASTGALYLTSAEWTDDGDRTRVFKFGIPSGEDAVPLVATGAVDGTVLNSYSMDEASDGTFRIATNDWATAGQSTGLYVMTQSGDELDVTGSVTHLANGESLRAARFVGDDRAYLVTFHQVDPLFTVDLSDAHHPRVAGELTIPGFSSYLQPVSDDLLLGLGRDVDANTNHDNGLQLSLFDVSDAAHPKRLAVTSLATSWSSSEAEAEPHAFSYFPEAGLLALPVQSFSSGSGEVKQSLVVVKVDAAKGSGALAKVAETAPPGGVRRSLRIGQVLYAVGPDHVQASDLDQPGNVLGTLATG